MKKVKKIKIGRSGIPRLAVLVQHVAGDPPAGSEGSSPTSQYCEGKWEHDQWEDKKRSLYEPEESDRQTRPRIDFTHLKIQKALDVNKGKMGDSSEKEDSKGEEDEQGDEIKGLPRTPTGDTDSEGEAEGEEEKPEEGENQEVEDEGEEAEEPGGDEGEEAQGDLNSFEAPPMSYKPSPNGPEGKDWTRVDFIVDSGASDSTIPKGILPNVPLGEVKVSKPLLSIGKMVEHGHTVTMTPYGGYIQLKGSKTKITIFQRNGVWKLPVWIWTPVGDSGFPGQGQP